MIKPSCRCHCDMDRRRVTSGLLLSAFAAASTGAWARATQTPVRADDERYMRIALDEAARGDFPFGAVIEKGGRVLATGHNSGKSTNDPTAHGEMVAIRNFIKSHPSAELNGATIYTTGEPCPMCMGAIIWCGFRRVVFAASIQELSTRLGQIMVTSETVAAAASFANIDITGGVFAKEALALFPPPVPE
ncbi:nucleoside deaminase [Methylocystis sp. ATCC 49242]|uniref:nucleoside deaminase n=1 Tax=Methylocystis sp. ATCC 49242 TaxID=622637 RepID=UPI0001F877CD|nr:nucleoside deaminase [Methylocystis sp. ATCC 49242]